MGAHVVHERGYDMRRPTAASIVAVPVLLLSAACATVPAPAPPTGTAEARFAPVPVRSSEPPPSPAAGGPSGPPGPCGGETLDITATAPRPDGAVVVRQLVFRNTGASTCVLSGYPGVTFVAGNAGTPVGPQAGIDGPRRTVELAAGAAATAPLRVRDVTEYPSTDCAAAQIRGIRVAPPGGRGGLFVPSPGRSCSGEVDPPQAAVGSVTPH